MSIFKACDIRGVAGRDLTDDLVRRIALAIGVILTGQQVVVGGDVRLSTPALQKMMIDGLVESGCQVLDIGTVATPVFYYALQTAGATGGVMVTASHNPAQYNGFKLVLGSKPVSEEQIAHIGLLVEQNARTHGDGKLTQLPVIEKYLEYTAGKANTGNLKIVLDAGSGATATIAPPLFKRLGYEVVELNCTPDGRFPQRPPNPALPENLAALGAVVRAEGAALGIGFDGDGDRVGVVDEAGRPLDNDDIMVLIARQYLAAGPGTIIYDAKCSMVVPEEVAKAGGRPIMARAGHTFSKTAFIQEQALFAGEISGHFFFRELGYDDGMFSGLKICELVAKQGSLAAQVDAIPNYLLTPDIRVTYTGSDKESILHQVAAKLAAYKPNRIDGVRIEFDDGWGMIRASVTEPLFTLRFEAKTSIRLREITATLLAALPAALREAVTAKLPAECS
ncbi:phosphomannomutase/phosphoglucomutase [Sporomusa acidovorans]|uniref:Phosphomannomutase/phosphoglucomutase n=1 Tax=Sporomusa acidovorans (strain ATCC 49682 / DSM 3132 / Mol) TaxID=1123286 RepID=A0ABZ3JA48_SPOA4|nr:phosphomannomutase/phosphoglucomutase [Sporomusa acidovorans]OZC22943.1 phosphomannomutase/phosphoglucomutase [Sporomusa acidovorans DSM 3132]SDE94502.1 phosphomannomutase / phosphoglucomutase [Sporomusa acidovorans]